MKDLADILKETRRPPFGRVLLLASIAAMGLAAPVLAQQGLPPLPPGTSPPPGGQIPPGAGPPPGGAAMPGFDPSKQLKLMAPLPPPPADAPKPTADPRDFAGMYVRDRGIGPPGGPPPSFLPAAGERSARRIKAMMDGKPIATPQVMCRPFPVATFGFDLFPTKVIQTPEKLVVLSEEGRSVWQIHLNRGHPQTLVPTYGGDTIGHWEGNTLVFEIVGFNGKQWMDMGGPQTSALRITGRIRKLPDGKLEVTTTREDPATYAEPPTSTYTASWHPELHLLEFACEENSVGAREGSVVE